MAEASGAIALDRMLDPVGRSLTPEVAQALMSLRADAETQARMDDLADKSSEGTLTPDERAEYEACVSANDFVGVLRAKARRLLAGTP